MRTFSIINQKGGCGKTTTAVNLSACLSELGRRVLMIDLDPQAHATLSFAYQPEKLRHSVYDIFSPSKAGSFDWNDILIQYSDNLFIAPSNLLLNFLDKELVDFKGKERILIGRIMELQIPFDYIIIDCPPSLGLLTVNSLNASSEVIVPVEPSFFSLHGLRKLLETVRLQEEKTGHIIRVQALATIYNGRNRFSREILKEIQEHFGDNLLTTTIRMSVRLKEAASFGTPISEYNRYSIAYKDYNALATEIILQEEQSYPVEKKVLLKPQLVNGAIVFRYKDPKANAVLVAGDFNNWSPNEGIMKKKGSNIWETMIPLDPGTYQYRFVVDGKWLPDPNNPIKADDNLGGFNSVVTIS